MLTAAALVGLIVLLLLGSWRPTLIVLTSLPLSILSALILLHIQEESINVMTLGGLALAVGILVDNAAVMIENVDTCLLLGKRLEEAVVDAAIQIMLPTFVATLSTNDVFPIDGRAATIIRSEGCSPDVISSRSVKPVGTPVMSSFRECSFSMVSRLDWASSRSEARTPINVGS